MEVPNQEVDGCQWKEPLRWPKVLFLKKRMACWDKKVLGERNLSKTEVGQTKDARRNRKWVVKEKQHQRTQDLEADEASTVGKCQWKH